MTLEINQLSNIVAGDGLNLNGMLLKRVAGTDGIYMGRSPKGQWILATLDGMVKAFPTAQLALIYVQFLKIEERRQHAGVNFIPLPKYNIGA